MWLQLKIYWLLCSDIHRRKRVRARVIGMLNTVWCDSVLKSGTTHTHDHLIIHTITYIIILLSLRDVDTNNFSQTNRVSRTCFPRCLSHHYNKLMRQRHLPAAYFVRHTQIDTSTNNEHPRLPWSYHRFTLCFSCLQVKRYPLGSAKRVWDCFSTVINYMAI